MTRRLIALVVAVFLFSSACGDSTDDGQPDPAASGDTANGDPAAAADLPDDAILSNPVDGLPQLALVTVSDELRSPVDLKQPPGDDRMFILQVRAGTILIMEDGEIREQPFLDISERLAENGDGDERGRGERGLLSLAFHPDYADNGRFFIWYADESGIAELAEYTVSDDPNVADPDSKVVLRDYPQSKDHFGGGLQFGPDGHLWLGVGDGGRLANAQDLTNSRGAIIRLDVSTPGNALPAPDNPFIDDPDVDDDIWAYGLRNPWRWSFDVESGLMYIGDVGRELVEEINVQPYTEPGINYGYAIVEGSDCFRLDAEDPVHTNCDTTGITFAAIEHPHPEACSITGGFVYRGEAIPELVGRYLYADYCTGFVRSFVYDDGVTDVVHLFDDVQKIASFALDHDGEIYVVTLDGMLRKLVAA